MQRVSARRDSIIRLLETRDDHLPEPTRRVDGYAAGFIHKTLAPVVCDVCEGVEPFGCTGCGGRGWVERKRERDPYSETKTSPAMYGLDGAKHHAAHERDREIEMLDRQLRPPQKEAELLDEANHSPYPWERARARMRRLYDYDVLDLALDELRAHDDGAYRALHAVYVYRWLTDAAGAAERACERGFAFLSPRLAAFELARGRKLRAPGGEEAPATRVAGPMRPEAGAAAKKTRDEAMRAAAANGSTVDDLRLQFGVSKSTVYAIVNQRDAA